MCIFLYIYIDHVNIHINHNMHSEGFRQYVDGDELSKRWQAWFHNRNVDIEAFHRHVCENGFSAERNVKLRRKLREITQIN